MSQSSLAQHWFADCLSVSRAPPLPDIHNQVCPHISLNQLHIVTVENLCSVCNCVSLSDTFVAETPPRLRVRDTSGMSVVRWRVCHRGPA